MSAPLFTPVGPDGGPLDPTKAVRYVEGMVLGVDDFQQEHAYLTGLANEALRLGAGAGTLEGLRVTAPKVPSTGAGVPDRFEVHVGKGVAIDGRGRLIRVPEEQCADLGAWVTAQSANITAKVAPTTTGAATPSVFVTVSYGQTATDAVPVPGEPCRTDAQVMAASRWADDFQLNFALDPPPPSRRREAIRQFLVWAEYAFTFAGGTVANALGQTEDALRACRAPAGGTPPRLLLPAKPGLPFVPVGIGKDDLDTQMACLDAATVVFVTEFLPDWLAAVSPAMPAETPNTLLLAEIKVPVKRTLATDTWALDTSVATLAPSSRGRPVAMGGPTLRVGPRGD